MLLQDAAKDMKEMIIEGKKDEMHGHINMEKKEAQKEQKKHEKESYKKWARKDASEFDTPTRRKRRRRPRSVRKIQPRRLFHEEEEVTDGRQPDNYEPEESEQMADQEAEESEVPSNDEDEMVGSQDLEDNDVFGGHFKCTTPAAKKSRAKPPQSATSNPPKSCSPADVDQSTKKILDENNELSKKVDKKILQCLPDHVNPFPA